jgi:hypothetical protein
MGIPRGSIEAKVHKYRFLDTHLRLDNEYAFHALALDEHREDFEPTFWTRTVTTGEVGAPEADLAGEGCITWRFLRAIKAWASKHICSGAETDIEQPSLHVRFPPQSGGANRSPPIRTESRRTDFGY